MIETDINTLILDKITKLPRAMFWRENSGLLRSPSSERRIRAGAVGIGDIMGVYWGMAIAFETKQRTGKQRTSQERFQAAFENAGGKYFIVRSVEDAELCLRQLPLLLEAVPYKDNPFI